MRGDVTIGIPTSLLHEHFLLAWLASINRNTVWLFHDLLNL